VKDDYTPASAIEWTFTPNSKLLITIVNGVASILSADKNWLKQLKLPLLHMTKMG
jgi:hypothetical protein